MSIPATLLSIGLLAAAAGLPLATAADDTPNNNTTFVQPAPSAATPFGLPPFDIRTADPTIQQAVAAALVTPEHIDRLEAAAALKRRAPSIKIDHHPTLGTPVFIRSLISPLTPVKQGQAADANTVVQSYITDNTRLFSINAFQLQNATITRDAFTEHNATRTLWWSQSHKGLPVFGAELRATVDANGRLITISSTMLSEQTLNNQTAPTQITRKQAIKHAATSVGVEINSKLTIKSSDAHKISYNKTNETQLDIDTETVYFPITADQLRPAYVIIISPKNTPDAYQVIIDANDGKTLAQRNMTHYGGTQSASYRVYTDDSPTPLTPGPPAPDGVQPPEVARTLETLISFNPTASPNGWLSDGTNETLGNNVDAHLDLNNDNFPDLPRPQGSPFRIFDFPLNLTDEPSMFRDAAVTQLFYMTNLYHDRLYELGFTEPFANFQSDNFGRGGSAGDAIMADAQDGQGTNNANFSTFGDGSTGRMQMFIFDAPTPMRDGDLDNQIIIHELTHGLSIRLIGDIGFTEQGPGMGEGWSDFFALCLLADPADDPDATYPMGAYATFMGASPPTNPPLLDNAYFGIRRYPYTTDLNKNPLTFLDIDPAQFAVNPAIPRNPSFATDSPPNASHPVGEVWCSALWECRRNLIATHGSSANEIMMQLVVDGLKLTPPSPNFLQARDAIILADMQNNAGANVCDLWAGFAKRGLGTGATSPFGASVSSITESFDAPTNLAFTYATVLPPIQERPSENATFQIQIDTQCGLPLIENTAILFVSIDAGPFNPFPMSPLGGGLFDAIFPPFSCANTVRYYVAASTASNTFTDPPNAPTNSFPLLVFSNEVIIAEDNFEADTGWTVGDPTDDATTGIWTRTDPVGTTAQPEDDNPAGVGTLCFITANANPGDAIGTNDVDGGTTTLISPLLDASGTGEAVLSYYRWYSNNQGSAPGADSMPIEISDDDGANWTLLELVTENNNAWTYKEFRLAKFISPTNQVRVRFRARDLSSGSIVEAGVDDLKLTMLTCEIAGADLDGDGQVGSSDLAILLGSWGPCPIPPTICAADLDGDGTVGSADLAIMLGSWG